MNCEIYACPSVLDNNSYLNGNNIDSMNVNNLLGCECLDGQPLYNDTNNFTDYNNFSNIYTDLNNYYTNNYHNSSFFNVNDIIMTFINRTVNKLYTTNYCNNYTTYQVHNYNEYYISQTLPYTTQSSLSFLELFIMFFIYTLCFATFQYYYFNGGWQHFMKNIDILFNGRNRTNKDKWNKNIDFESLIEKVKQKNKNLKKANKKLRKVAKKNKKDNANNKTNISKLEKKVSSLKKQIYKKNRKYNELHKKYDDLSNEHEKLKTEYISFTTVTDGFIYDENKDYNYSQYYHDNNCNNSCNYCWDNYNLNNINIMDDNINVLSSEVKLINNKSLLDEFNKYLNNKENISSELNNNIWDNYGWDNYWDNLNDNTLLNSNQYYNNYMKNIGYSMNDTKYINIDLPNNDEYNEKIDNNIKINIIKKDNRSNTNITDYLKNKIDSVKPKVSFDENISNISINKLNNSEKANSYIEIYSDIIEEESNTNEEIIEESNEIIEESNEIIEESNEIIEESNIDEKIKEEEINNEMNEDEFNNMTASIIDLEKTVFN